VKTRKHSRAAARIALGGACSHQLRESLTEPYTVSNLLDMFVLRAAAL